MACLLTLKSSSGLFSAGGNEKAPDRSLLLSGTNSTVRGTTLIHGESPVRLTRYLHISGN